MRIGIGSDRAGFELKAVIARQMPDAAKRRKADVVIQTGLSRNHALRSLRRIIQDLRQ